MNGKFFTPPKNNFNPKASLSYFDMQNLDF